MAELKTRATDADPAAFVASVEDPVRRADAGALLDLMASVTGAPAVMWGPSIVGFGERHLRYASGRELDWFEIGFSPRKAATTMYLPNVDDVAAELAGLGPHTLGKGCVYVKRLADTDAGALRRLLEAAVARARHDDATP